MKKKSTPHRKPASDKRTSKTAGKRISKTRGKSDPTINPRFANSKAFQDFINTDFYPDGPKDSIDIFTDELDFDPDDEAAIPVSKLCISDVYGYLSNYRRGFKDRVVYMGGWHDLAAAEVYLDVRCRDDDWPAKTTRRIVVSSQSVANPTTVPKKNERVCLHIGRPEGTSKTELRNFAAVFVKSIKKRQWD